MEVLLVSGVVLERFFRGSSVILGRWFKVVLGKF